MYSRRCFLYSRPFYVTHGLSDDAMDGKIKCSSFSGKHPYQSRHQILSILLLAGCWEEDDVVYGLNELQLNHTLYEQPGKQPLIRHP